MNYNTEKEVLENIDKVLAKSDLSIDIKHQAKMIMYRFLSEIEHLSEEQGLSRKDIAKGIGTSPSFVTQLFRGNKLINLETIAKLQQFFDVKFEIKALRVADISARSLNNFYTMDNSTDRTEVITSKSTETKIIPLNQFTFSGSSGQDADVKIA